MTDQTADPNGPHWEVVTPETEGSVTLPGNVYVKMVLEMERLRKRVEELENGK